MKFFFCFFVFGQRTPLLSHNSIPPPPGVHYCVRGKNQKWIFFLKFSWILLHQEMSTKKTQPQENQSVFAKNVRGFRFLDADALLTLKRLCTYLLPHAIAWGCHGRWASHSHVRMYAWQSVSKISKQARKSIGTFPWVLLGPLLCRFVARSSKFHLIVDFGRMSCAFGFGRVSWRSESWSWNVEGDLETTLLFMS